MTINKNDIQEGDEVQISYLGLTSDKWFPVYNYDHRILIKSRVVWLVDSELEILAHRKNLKALTDEVDRTEAEVVSLRAKLEEATLARYNARKALEQAQKATGGFYVGARVKHKNDDSIRGKILCQIPNGFGDWKVQWDNGFTLSHHEKYLILR